MERLIDYNRSDVMNLKVMMDHCFIRLVDHHAELFPKNVRVLANTTYKYPEFARRSSLPIKWLRRLGINLSKR